VARFFTGGILETLRSITGMYQETTYFVIGEKLAGSPLWTADKTSYGGWSYTPLDTLMKDIESVVEAKQGGMMVISFLLLCIALLAILLGTLWGVPLLYWLRHTGIPMPDMSDQAGLAIGEKIIPAYGISVQLGQRGHG